MKPYDRVVIVGMGLLGTSLALAMKERDLAGHIVGLGRRREPLLKAHSMGAIDEISLDRTTALHDAGLVVLATPTAAILDLLEQLRDLCPRTALVIDVGSTKSAICDLAALTWPAPRRFVGCHPMAGSEKAGPEHARPDLYERHVCLIEQSPGLDPKAAAEARALWEAVGAEVHELTPDLHDALLARTSHIPHIVSAALACLAVKQGDVRKLIGNGFRDMTRIAGGKPELWRDICLTNNGHIVAGLEELEQDIRTFRDALRAGDAEALLAFFEAGKDARRKAVEP